MAAEKDKIAENLKGFALSMGIGGKDNQGGYMTVESDGTITNTDYTPSKEKGGLLGGLVNSLNVVFGKIKPPKVNTEVNVGNGSLLKIGGLALGFLLLIALMSGNKKRSYR